MTKNNWKKVLIAVLMMTAFLLSAVPSFAKEAPVAPVLVVEDVSLKAALEPAFDPDVTEYRFAVQSDIYGVGFTVNVPEEDPPREVAVTIDGVETEVNTRYVVELSQEQEDYGKVIERDVEIVLTEGDESKTYTVTIEREDASALYDAFEIREYEDEETGAKIDYALYVPEDYDPAKSYPLVIAMHGSGQSKQPIDMVLRRYEMATTWVKNGYDCIVFAPHSHNLNAEEGKFDTQWSTAKGTSPLALGESGKITYKIIEELREEFSIDLNRQYLTGLSMGGWGVYAMIADHPDDWAGALLSCATTWDNNEQIAEIVKEYEIPVWIFHAPDDPVRSFGEFAKIVNALNDADADYRVTVYKNDEIFYPSAHFSWTPMYADTAVLDWLFAQVKGE